MYSYFFGFNQYSMFFELAIENFFTDFLDEANEEMTDEIDSELNPLSGVLSNQRADLTGEDFNPFGV